MTSPQGIWFVYRSHYEGLLSKRIRRLTAPSILQWFQDKITEARTSLTPADIADADFGGTVHGFSSLFEAAKKDSLHTPKTTAALAKLLREHLHIEGGPENIRVDEHSLRVLTSDGQVELAYFFFDDESVKKHPGYLAYLLHEGVNLPDGNAEGPFKPPFAVHEITPAGAGEGATYAALLTFHDGKSIPGDAVKIDGVRLPGLAAHLRSVVPDSKTRTSSDALDTWPIEIRLLRALVQDGDTTIRPALTRAAAYPLMPVTGAADHSRIGIGEHAAAHGEFLAAAEGHTHGGDPARSVVHDHDHVALLAAHTSNQFGFQQWILFDDRWAAAHPDLASSILQYAHSPDPFALRVASRETRAQLREEKVAAPKAEKAAAKPKKGPGKTKADAAATKQEKAWSAAVAGRTEDDARGYRPSERFTEGELVNHTKFGLGVVVRVEVSKCELLFRDTPRVMVHSLSA